MSKFSYTSKRDDYRTPPSVFEPILRKLKVDKFDLDVCCSIRNVPALKYFIDGENDGLKEPWAELNWMNPPFSTCEKWVRKAVAEQLKGKTTHSILPVRTETLFWRECILENKNTKCKFLLKNKVEGVTFIDPVTNEPVKIKCKNPKTKELQLVDGLFKNPLAIVIFKGVK